MEGTKNNTIYRFSFERTFTEFAGTSDYVGKQPATDEVRRNTQN